MRRVHCLYCHALILGVHYVPDDLDVFVLYAHKACHSERRCVDPDATWRMLCDALHALHTNRDDHDVRERAIEPALSRCKRGKNHLSSAECPQTLI